MRRIPNWLALLSALTNQPTLVPEPSVIHYERRHDYGDRAQALIDEWNAMSIAANIAAPFYTYTGDPKAKKPRVVDPQQAQFHEKPFIAAAAFFRRAGSDVAIGAANPARLSFITGDAIKWLEILRHQDKGRWNPDRKLMFAQAVVALRAITDADGMIRNGCDWQPLEMSFRVTAQRGDVVDVEVQLTNPNEADSPIPALLFLGSLGLSLIEWPKRKSVPALKRTKTKFRLRLGRLLDVRYASSTEIQG